MKLTFYSATAMEISCLSQGLEMLVSEQTICPKNNISVYARTNIQLFNQGRISAFVEQAINSDVIILSLHGGKASCPAFDELLSALKDRFSESDNKRPWLHIQPTGGDLESLDLARDHSTGFATPAWDAIHGYLNHGGGLNFKHLLEFLGILVCKTNRIGFPNPEHPPVSLANEGIYHPDFNGPVNIGQYLREKLQPHRPTVGLWFNQSYWVNNNLNFINALIRACETRGANVIPVFHLRFKDEILGNLGADHVADHFFKQEGGPLIDVLINPMMFSLNLAHKDYETIYPDLDVPVIQAMLTLQPREAWEESDQGMTSMEVSFSAAQPEFDGTLISVPIACREQDDIDPLTGAMITRYEPIPDRVDRLVSLALNWARLSKKENRDKRVAVIFHHYPPRNDRIGCAAGLDSFESVNVLLENLRDKGYTVAKGYEDGTALAREILGTLTYDQRWLLPEQMAQHCHARAGKEHFEPWHRDLPSVIKKKQVSDWGAMPGELFVHDNELLFSGIKNGNIFITVQPPRDNLQNIDKAYHDMYLSCPHHYLAQYRYIKEVFKADAVIHVGKHGSLEWLPGKALGLSQTCYPDLSIMDLPNIYPYIINDPSEGTQAKRRSCACIIDHLTPVFTNADLYEEMSDLDNRLKEYQDAVKEDPGKLAVLRPMVWEAAVTADLDKDLGLTENEAMGDFTAFLEKLHILLSEVSDTMINDGLHTLGIPPQGKRLAEFIVQMTRINNGPIPSLRESILKNMGHDYDHLLENKGKEVAQSKTGRDLISLAHASALDLVTALVNCMESAQGAIPQGLISKLVKDHVGRSDLEIEEILTFLNQQLVPDIQNTRDEISAALAALDGRFVKPGASGAPTRGQADILPTGKNFYSVDPNKIPSLGAWETGKNLAHALMDRYQEETGELPRSVGIVVYGGSTMRSRGDDVAQIFYLLGVKPLWHRTNASVMGLEIIPLKTLGRPRIDVLPRISGFFRDAFPILVERIDQAVRMVAALDEPLDSNMIRRHVIQDTNAYMAQGMDRESAMAEASFRVFGCPPGTYGAGVSELVESKNWDTTEDLGNAYIRYSSHAYGKKSYGTQKPTVFKQLLGRMDVTVKNEDSREYDLMSCTDYYNYYGGLIAAGKTVTGQYPVSLVGDSSDPNRVKMRTTAQEAKHILRARLVNPKWLDGMKRHGYKGAGDISHMMDVALGWDATANLMEDWMYNRLAKAYAMDPAMKEWMVEVNPYARQNILDKLLEAISRGMWEADAKVEAKLKEEYLEIEGEIEGINE